MLPGHICSYWTLLTSKAGCPWVGCLLGIGAMWAVTWNALGELLTGMTKLCQGHFRKLKMFTTENTFPDLSMSYHHRYSCGSQCLLHSHQEHHLEGLMVGCKDGSQIGKSMMQRCRGHWKRQKLSLCDPGSCIEEWAGTRTLRGGWTSH